MPYMCEHHLCTVPNMLKSQLCWQGSCADTSEGAYLILVLLLSVDILLDHHLTIGAGVSDFAPHTPGPWLCFQLLLRHNCSWIQSMMI